MTVEVGTRIYYTGDMANESSWGTVTGIAGGRFGTQVCVALDTGRDAWVPAPMIGERYDGTCGVRFVTKAAYDAWRAERIAAYDRWAKRAGC